MDAEKIKDGVRISDVVSRYVRLTAKGGEHEGLCPFHNEKTPSFTVVDSKGFFHCFGCGENGDVFDFVQKMERCSFPEAKDKVATDAGFSSDNPPERLNIDRAPAVPEWVPILPVPKDAPEFDGTTYNPKTKKRFNHKPVAVYPYRSLRGGRLLGYVMRVERDGKKQTPMVTYCEGPDGVRDWCMRGFPDPRPLYGLDRLRDTGAILIVEGEKAADAAHARIGEHVSVISWPGGAGGIRKAKWNPLRGRRVVVWPDNDEPGLKAAAEIAVLIDTESVTIIAPLKGEKGADAADLDDRLDMRDWLRGRIKDQQPEKTPEKLPEPSAPDDPPPPDDYEPVTPHKAPFKILGYDRDVIYYLPRGRGQLVALSNAAHTENNMLALAGLDYWEARYPNKGGVNWTAAKDEAFRAIEDRGLGTFKPHDQMRGVGAWLDEGRTILHVGNKLIVDGSEVHPWDLKSQSVYEIGRALDIDLGDPLPSSESRKLADLCNMLPFENPDTAGALLSGWLVIAPLCGMLPWRPHMWITGPASSGKSTVMSKIIGPVLGKIALKIEGATTEAGIRQELGADARPVVFDEAEAENEQAQGRIAKILELARTAASESGGTVLKGTAGQTGAISFRIRSCFVFSSINQSAKELADEQRILSLTMSKPKNNPEHYQRLLAMIREVTTPEFLDGLFSRSLKNLPVLQANILTFGQAAASVLGQNIGRRAGDLFGAALAGHYSLYKTDMVTFKAAVDWMEQFDWQNHSSISPQSDATRLLQRILSKSVRVENGQGRTGNRTLGEIIEVAAGANAVDDVLMNSGEAEAVARRNGLRTVNVKRDDYSEPGVYVSNSYSEIKKILANTAWSAHHDKTLLQFEGAKKADAVRFAAIATRAVWVPFSAIEGMNE